MNIKTKIALIGIVVTTAVLFAYATFRTQMLEREYAATLNSTGDRLVLRFMNFERDKTIAERNIAAFMESVALTNDSLAVFALADASGRLLGAGRNDRYIHSQETLDTIIAGFMKGEYDAPKGATYVVRYFLRVKFYVLVKNTPEGKALLLIPYRLRGKLLIKFVLELLLIVVLGLLACASIYLYLLRRGRVDRPHPYYTTRAPHEEGGPDEKTASPASEARGPAKQEVAIALDLPEDTEEKLRIRIINFFGSIESFCAPESIGFFARAADIPSKLKKLFEQRGKTFISVDTAQASTIDIGGDIGEELGGSSTLVLDAGKRLVIPLLSAGRLLGALEVVRGYAFNGPEINELQLQMKSASEELEGYLAKSSR